MKHILERLRHLLSLCIPFIQQGLSFAWKYIKIVGRKIQQHWKKILIIGLIIILVLFFALHQYIFLRQFRSELKDTQKSQSAIIDDIAMLKQSLVQECESANTLRNYLLLPLKDCLLLVSTPQETSTATETPEQALYFYLTLLKGNQEKNRFEQHITQYITTWTQENIDQNTQTPLQIQTETHQRKDSITITLFPSTNRADTLQIQYLPLDSQYFLTFEQQTKEFAHRDEITPHLTTALQQWNTNSLQANDPDTSLTPPPSQSPDNPTPTPIDEPENLTTEESPEAAPQQLDFLYSPELDQYTSSLDLTFIQEDDEQTPLLAIIEEDGTPIRHIFRDEETAQIMASKPDGSGKVTLIGLKEKILEADRESQIKADLSHLQQISPDHKPGRENHLLLGRNGGNVDTIILANVDHQEKEITLISIPRDLFVDTYKINAFYSRYGMNAFVSQIEKLTGQRITHYGLIDFNIFMDAIDALGGINITLSRDIVDPTYRTVDDGVESTMYFAKGTHHLSGVQALRLARSRATSSDFARAARQHQILQAIQEKSLSLGIRNANTIISLIRAMLQRVETNASPQEAVSLFFQLKDYEVKGGNVMSTANILTSQMRELPSGARQYILAPRDNDWSLIKKYVWSKILD